jgi:hypothetical protein
MDLHHLSSYAYGIKGTCHVSYIIFHLYYFSPMDRLCFVISSLLNLLWCDFCYDQELSLLRLSVICNFIDLHHIPHVPMKCFFQYMNIYGVISQHAGIFIIDNYFIYTIYLKLYTVSNVKKLEYS